ncbi:MAG: hypothetical protein IPL61_02545 [Myxococcales bacterium]|nr:hypothetical protein [Myxococcales bacterium]
MPTTLRALALVGPSLAACQTVAPGREVEVVLRGERDGVVLTRTATGCRADDVAVEVTATGAAGGAWRLAVTEAGAELTHDGALAARIVDEAGPPLRRSYLDPMGVPLARVTISDDAAVVVGPDRAPLGRFEPAERELRWLDATGRATARVTGTTDLTLAAALAAPPVLPIGGRAIVACARLAATTPSPAK